MLSMLQTTTIMKLQYSRTSISGVSVSGEWVALNLNNILHEESTVVNDRLSTLYTVGYQAFAGPSPPTYRGSAVY